MKNYLSQFVKRRICASNFETAYNGASFPKRIVLVLLLSISLNSYSQMNKEYNSNELIGAIALEYDKAYVLYYGVDIPMTILFSNTNTEQVQIGSDLREEYLKIEGSNGRYVLSLQPSILDSLGELLFKSLKLNCYKVIPNKDTVLLGVRTFRIKKLPKPQISISGKTIEQLNGSLSLKQLRLNPFLTLLYRSDFPISIKSTMYGCEVKAITPDGPFHMRLMGNSLNSLIQSPMIVPGTVLFFKNIMAKGPNGKIFFIDDFKLELTE